MNSNPKLETCPKPSFSRPFSTIPYRVQEPERVDETPSAPPADWVESPTPRQNAVDIFPYQLDLEQGVPSAPPYFWYSEAEDAFQWYHPPRSNLPSEMRVSSLQAVGPTDATPETGPSSERIEYTNLMILITVKCLVLFSLAMFIYYLYCTR